jgi:hypothetical protein
MIDLGSAPKNIGHDRWVINMANVHEVADSYLYALRLRAQNVWLKRYWTDYIKVLVRNQSTSPYTLAMENYELLPGALEAFEAFTLDDEVSEDIFTSIENLDILYPYSVSEDYTAAFPTEVFDLAWG